MHFLAIFCDFVRYVSELFRVEYRLPICTRLFIAPPPPPPPSVPAVLAPVCPFRVASLVSPVCSLVEPLAPPMCPALGDFFEEESLVKETTKLSHSGLLTTIVIFGCFAVLAFWAVSFLFSFASSPSPSPPHFEVPTYESLLEVSPTSTSSTFSPPPSSPSPPPATLSPSLTSPTSPIFSTSLTFLTSSVPLPSAAALPHEEVNFSKEVLKKRFIGIAPAKIAGGSRRKSKKHVALK